MTAPATPVVVDTQILVWYLGDESSLSSAALETREATEEEGRAIGVSAITFFELTYVVDKGGLSLDTVDEIRRQVTDASTAYEPTRSIWTSSRRRRGSPGTC